MTGNCGFTQTCTSMMANINMKSARTVCRNLFAAS